MSYDEWKTTDPNDTAYQGPVCETCKHLLAEGECDCPCCHEPDYGREESPDAR